MSSIERVDEGVVEQLGETAAMELAGELRRLAVTQAGLDHAFCALVARFDAGVGIGWFAGMKSTAHFLAFACAMSPSVAREHVRVARALGSMPQTDALFAQGRLSYSKVRELTRLVGQIDEAELLALAVEMTASQLARTVSSFRTAAGTRVRAQEKRSFSMTERGDGMVRLSVCLPAEDAAVITAAVEEAIRRCSEPDAEGGGPAGTPPDRVQALVDVAGVYLDGLEAEPSDDHTLVVVHVSAEQLAAGVPAGTSEASTGAAPVDGSAIGEVAPAPGDVPTGPPPRPRSTLAGGTCHVVGHGPIEAATAQRLACTSRLLGALTDRHGTVLALGRTTRLATRAQRRALAVRDHGTCQFPGCHQTRHLDAHHRTPWSHGGATDLDNLLLLCRRHHVLVHEGGLIITPGSGVHRHTFHLPDGQPLTGTWREDAPVDQLEYTLAHHTYTTGDAHDADDDSADRLTPRHGGAGFSLFECVRVLFDAQTELPDHPVAA